jgi:predicted Zn-dependent protease
MDHKRRQLVQLLGWAGLASCLGGCRTAPLTGRQQLMLIPEGQEVALGQQAFDDLMSQQPASQNLPLVQLVNRVGHRIAEQAERPDFDWQFRLLAANQQNAFCLPGGKVAVYEGILPVCQNEAGLAVVMSHEIAHALARHGGERMSQTMFQSGTRDVLGRIARARVPDKAERLMQAYGIATEYGILLPYSRQQETEADHMGVMLMARAGYDPNEAPGFWKRFAAQKTEELPEFLSTHPSDERRAANLLALMGEAGQWYAAADEKLGRGQSIVAPPTS